MPRSLAPFGWGQKNRLRKGNKLYKGSKRWAGIPTRLQQQVKNNLGIIMTDQMSNAVKTRNDDMELFDAYYDNTVYDGLQDWEDALKAGNEAYVPIRERKPRIIYNVAKVLVDKVGAKIYGEKVFPTFTIEDDPDDTQFFSMVQKYVGFRAKLIEPIKRTLLGGSCFVRYFLVDGAMHMEWFKGQYCYPKFDDKDELDTLEVKYVYEDPNEKDAQGNYKCFWYRLVLSKTADILYDNPEYREGVEPDFKEVDRNDHKLGWVQGEWLRTSKHKFDPDGDSLIGDILDFIDDLNYSLSQSSQAVAYNQDPQLLINGVDEDELDKLIKSSQKGWNLGKEGEAKLLESDLKGVETAEENRDHNRHRMLEVVRVVLHDPEKIVGSATSGKAMELLHGPLIELLDELRAIFEPVLLSLLIKISLTILVYIKRGEEVGLQVPPGYVPQSLDLTVTWPPIFPMTLDDLLKKAQICNTLSMARIISKESLTRWIGPDVGVENIDEELQKIEAQPIDNPFGTFGGGQ